MFRLPSIVLTAAFVLNAGLLTPTLLPLQAAEGDSAGDAPSVQAFSPVQSILQAKCFRCHGVEEQHADVRLDQLSTDLVAVPRDAETWHDALNAINRGEMPPEDEAPLTPQERRTLTRWVSSQLDRLKQARKPTGGQVILRRLNRREYQNTMVDLLGVDRDYTENLPPDPVSKDGFHNNGSVLRMSGMQLEFYLEAARKGLASAIVEGPAPKVFEHTTTESDEDKNRRAHWSTRLGRTGRFVARVPNFPDEGVFEIRVKAHAEIPSGAAWPIMQVKLGYRSDTRAPAEIVDVVEVPDTESTEFIFRGRLEDYPIQSRTQSKYPGMLIWIDNILDDGKPDPKPIQVEQDSDSKKKRKQQKLTWPEDPNFSKIVLEKVSFVAPVYQSWPPHHQTNILPRLPESEEDERAAAVEAIDHFLPRAFRRPINKTDRETLLKYFGSIRPSAPSFEAAMRETFALALVSPEFLYLAEPRGEDETLDEFQLASRLSYFLWSTMPDEKLMSLAHHGKLTQPNVLRAQVDRMLQDERSDRFLQSFSAQWLDLSGVDRVAVNPEFYPEFDNALKPYLKQETQQFFAEVVRNGLSAMTLLNADFAMLNEPLARHYGIKNGPRGISYQRVAWPTDEARGGLLGQGAILLANSTGGDSHPIKRAVWIRDRLLNDPPSPPPPNVPDLNQDLPKVASLPLKDQLKLHLENEACADCHRGIDPWGVALDGFGATGLTRETISRPHPTKRNQRITHPVDAAVQLPDGTHINGYAELRDYLVDHKADQFARALVERLLTYATGRSLAFTDRDSVDHLTRQFQDADYNIKELIKHIVCSDTFRQ